MPAEYGEKKSGRYNEPRECLAAAATWNELTLASRPNFVYYNLRRSFCMRDFIVRVTKAGKFLPFCWINASTNSNRVGALTQ